MAKYVYEVVDKYINKASNIEELFSLVLSDSKGIDEFKRVRNIEGEDNIKEELSLIVTSYPELKKKFDI